MLIITHNIENLVLIVTVTHTRCKVIGVFLWQGKLYKVDICNAEDRISS